MLSKNGKKKNRKISTINECMGNYLWHILLGISFVQKRDYLFSCASSNVSFFSEFFVNENGNEDDDSNNAVVIVVAVVKLIVAVVAIVVVVAVILFHCCLVNFFTFFKTYITRQYP